MTFKEITLDDYSKLIPFWRKNYFVGDMDSYDNFKLFLEKNSGLSILAEENNEIIGTALGSFDGRRGYLQKLVVDKTYRKKGIGKQLVEKVVNKLKTLEVTYIPISVEPELVSFYTNCGFKKATQISMKLEMDK